MFKKLATLFLVALAVSPFTAPFQTYDPPQILSPVLIDENNPGSLIAPLATDAGRLKIALPVGFGGSGLSALCPVALLMSSIALPSAISDRSNLSTVLRL
jgi:hypothetical protein